MKKLFEKFVESGGLIVTVYILAALIIFGVCLGVTWLIAESDMPEWVKFWLLR